MVDAFGEISFLTRSENRVEVLSVLAGETYTERELVTETGISDVTVGRILEDFAERGWIVTATDGGGYRASALGELLAEDYRRLEESMDLAARLGPVLDLLPLETMDFDVRLLAEGRVSDPETFDPLTAVDRWKQLLRRTDRFVGVAPAATATTVVTEPYYEAVTNRDETRRHVRAELEAGTDMYLADIEGNFTVSVAAFDDVATVAGYDDAGKVQLGIESRADPVLQWVVDRFESYRADASRLEPADFE
jgi:predicted transcriptional regulator